MGPQNGIVGDDNFGTDIPQTQVPDVTTDNETVAAANFNNSTEFDRLKTNMQARIEYWQKYLPGGTPADQLNHDERAWRWLAADSVITELRAIMDAYQGAADAVKEANEANQPATK